MSTIEDYAAKAQQGPLPPTKPQRKPLWYYANGAPYRAAMRMMHRFGWCYPEASYPDGDVVFWCKWCGLRGRR